MINLSSKINIIYSIYIIKLGLYNKKINISKQKIDEFYLNSFEMVIVDCLVQNKLKKIRFLLEIFMLANISLELVLGIYFFTFNKVNIWFIEQIFV